MIGEGATSVEKWLSPEPSALQRVRAEVAAALAKVPRVRRIALFGSLAEDRADRWSDIDMFVACEGGQAARWAAAGAIRAAKPVLYYQMFSTAEQPSGRYWFEGESVSTNWTLRSSHATNTRHNAGMGSCSGIRL